MPTSPRFIHRCWLGPNTPPVEHDYSFEWLTTNPEWRLLTWTDRNVHELFPLVCQKEYDCAPTFVHRADIVMVEAVYALGGVAVGYDMEPLKPLDPLVEGHDCWCTPDADGFAGGAFFGAIPHHPTIRLILDTIKTRIGRDGWHDTGPHLDTGPWLWGEVFGRYHEHAAELGMEVLGDWQTAYPIRYWEKNLFHDPTVYAERTANSVVVHRFAGSWLSTDVRVRR